MYETIHGVLSDRKGGEIFRCFSPVHFLYIIAAICGVIVICLLARKKSREKKDKIAAILINTVFGMYIADFFLMPFAYEYIDIEKLPFHACTATCVACFLSRHTAFFGRYKTQFALLGLVSNFIYLIYPAGVMWHAVHPLSYRVIQTLLFHALMSVYCLITLIFERDGISCKNACRALATVSLMTIWAVIGNLLYTGKAGTYDGDFNWFFVTADPFGMIDPKIAPYVMPLIDIAVFFAVEMGVYMIFYLISRIKNAKKLEIKKSI